MLGHTCTPTGTSPLRWASSARRMHRASLLTTQRVRDADQKWLSALRSTKEGLDPIERAEEGGSEKAEEDDVVDVLAP